MATTLINNKYRITRRIGGGSFGEIYLGIGPSGEKVAIKFERQGTRCPQLRHEYKVYRELAKCPGFCSVYHFGTQDNYNVMVMDLLGPSLEDLFNKCSRKFSLKTVLQIADQMLERVDTLHSRHLIHRDIKPANFVVGVGETAGSIFCVDFGLSKRYRHPKSLQHIPHRDGRSLTGTPRYASINNHLGIEQSRRDDLESIGYVLIYFLKGSLPWQGLKAKNAQKKYRMILEKKQQVSIAQLCQGCPSQFAEFLAYTRSLKFDAKPDIAYLRKLFRDLYHAQGLGNSTKLWDWDSFDLDFSSSSAAGVGGDGNGPIPGLLLSNSQNNSAAGIDGPPAGGAGGFRPSTAAAVNLGGGDDMMLGDGFGDDPLFDAPNLSAGPVNGRPVMGTSSRPQSGNINNASSSNNNNNNGGTWTLFGSRSSTNPNAAATGAANSFLPNGIAQGNSNSGMGNGAGYGNEMGNDGVPRRPHTAHGMRGTTTTTTSSGAAAGGQATMMPGMSSSHGGVVPSYLQGTVMHHGGGANPAANGGLMKAPPSGTPYLGNEEEGEEDHVVAGARAMMRYRRTRASTSDMVPTSGGGGGAVGVGVGVGGPNPNNATGTNASNANGRPLSSGYAGNTASASSNYASAKKPTTSTGLPSGTSGWLSSNAAPNNGMMSGGNVASHSNDTRPKSAGFGGGIMSSLTGGSKIFSNSGGAGAGGGGTGSGLASSATPASTSHLASLSYGSLKNRFLSGNGGGTTSASNSNYAQNNSNSNSNHSTGGSASSNPAGNMSSNYGNAAPNTGGGNYYNNSASNNRNATGSGNPTTNINMANGSGGGGGLLGNGAKQSRLFGLSR